MAVVLFSRKLKITGIPVNALFLGFLAFTVLKFLRQKAGNGLL